MTLFRYNIYAPNGGKRGSLSHPSEVAFSSPVNELSSMSLSYMPDHPGAEFLTSPCEVGVESSSTGTTWAEIPNGRYMLMGRDFEEIGENRLRKYTLPGYAWQLNKVRQMKLDGLNADGKRPFLSATAGMIIGTLLQEAKAQGIAPGFEWDFTSTKDSAGVNWAKQLTIYYEPGLDVYTILDNLAAQGICDWRMVGRELQLFNADTVMGVHTQVKLKPGVDVKALPVRTSMENLINEMLVLGDGGVRLALTNPSVNMPWGSWQGFLSNGGVNDVGTMTLLGNALLEAGGHEKVQYTAEVNPEKTSYNVFHDFIPGSFVTGPAEDNEVMEYRVRQVNITDNPGESQKIDLVINDQFTEREIQTSKKTNGIVGGATAGGSGAMPTRDDIRIPKQVEGLVVAPSAYLSVIGIPTGQVTIAWGEVTHATNDTVIENVKYEVMIRRAIVNEGWRRLAYTTDLRFSYSPVDIGTQYQFKVAAVIEPGPRRGEYSEVKQVLIEGDAEAPPKPSAPILTTKLGTITVVWDGKTSTGAEMPLDFDRLDVYWTGTNPLPGTKALGILRVGSGEDFLVATGLSVDVQQFWFVAVDLSGNQSPISDKKTITPVRITGPDIQANTVTANEIAAGAITTVALDALAVTAGKIAVGAVTTNKIYAGAITAAKIAAHTITAGQIAANAIGVAELAAGAVTADAIQATAITGKTITGGTINGTVINGVTVNTGGAINFGTGASLTNGGSGTTIQVNGQLWVSSTLRGSTITSDSSVSGDGFYLGPSSSRLAAQTTTASANMHHSDGNSIYRSSSLRKYKKKPRVIKPNYGILEMKARTWLDSQQLKDNPNLGDIDRIAGFIAEEVEAVSKEYEDHFESLLIREQGNLQGLAYDRFPAFMIPVMRDMVKRIENLEVKTNGS